MSAEFDRHADDYRAQVERSIAFSGLPHDYFLQAKIDLLRALFAERFGAARPSLLDVGCGVGSLHAGLKPIVSRLSGCDVSGEALARARLQHPDVDYRVSGRTALPFADAGHDVAIAVCVFHHVEPAARLPLAQAMLRAVRPGGLVVIVEHNPFNPATRLAVRRCRFDHDAILLASGEARGLLESAGADAVESRHFLLLPSASGPARRVERLLQRWPLGAQFAAIGRRP